MTGSRDTNRRMLDRLADALAEDTLRARDADILADFREVHGDPTQNSVAMRTVFERAVLIANKDRLAAARLAVAETKGTSSTHPLKKIDLKLARARLRALAAAKNLPVRVTLAARKESELSDNDVLGMLEDLAELGVVLTDSDEGRK